MTSRERLRAALHHQATDRAPIDVGATWVTGIAAGALTRLRAALGLPPKPLKINEPFQLLGEVEDDVRSMLGIDVVGLWPRATYFGFTNEGWKPWKLPDGTDVLVPRGFQTTVEANGDTLIYPRGDRTARPSGRLPKGGYFFDAIVRQGEINEDHLDPADFAEQFGTFSEEDLIYFEATAERLYKDTEYGIIGNFGGGGLGDIAQVPGAMLINPRGVRDPQLWYECLATHPDYIKGIFEIQTRAALKNMELLHEAVGDKLDVLNLSGTDFGTQRGPFTSLGMFQDLWKPYYRRMNDWVHTHTKWKIFYHSCGAIQDLLDDFVEVGVDILNPVQCSAEGMDAAKLKAKYGGKVVFWGGGVDTQRVLPFGRPEEVRRQVRERMDIFSRGGGFVFNAIHNIQAPTPVENLLAMFEEALGRKLKV